MLPGVAITPDEADEIKREIIEKMMDGYGTTFSLAVQQVNKAGRTVIYEWRKADPKFEAAIAAARRIADQNLLDLAENARNNVLKNPKHKDHVKAILHTLDRKGPELDRGYMPTVKNTIDDMRPPKEVGENATMEELQEAMAAWRRK